MAMPRLAGVFVSALAAAALAGCVFVGVDHDIIDGVLEDQTERAIAVCGAGNVASVDVEGFRCVSQDAVAGPRDL